VGLFGDDHGLLVLALLRGVVLLINSLTALLLLLGDTLALFALEPALAAADLGLQVLLRPQAILNVCSRCRSALQHDDVGRVELRRLQPGAVGPSVSMPYRLAAVDCSLAS